MRMQNKNVDKGIVKFNIESALLEELGERLVAKPEIAITELIKNAHDADATICNVKWEDDKLIISDDGSGMTLEAFKTKWMTIATSNKRYTPFTEKFNRPVTGAKGVGRFSVRFLGSLLSFETTAYYPDEKKYKTLKAVFDWDKLSAISNLVDLEVTYEIFPSNIERSGTTLVIERLKSNFYEVDEREIKTELLKVISPFSALRPSGKFKDLFRTKQNNSDPGFEVDLTGGQKTLAEDILDNYVARAVLCVSHNKIDVEVSFRDRNVEDGLYVDNKSLVFKKIIDYPNTIGSDVYLDIRYFPRRGGVFRDKGFDGRDAASWVVDNHGVAIYDRNFRVKPYGEEDDDWLGLDRDAVRSARKWDTDLMPSLFGNFASDPSSNPMLYLPKNGQVVGAVFLESSKNYKSEQTLIPSMDRSGFINNLGFRQLREAIRFAAELIAYFDRKLTAEFAEQQAAYRTRKANEDIKDVITEIEASPHLTTIDKSRIVKHYVTLKDNIQEIDDYHRKARTNIESMSLLGAVAGFMTHEYQSMLFQLNKTLKIVEQLATHDSSLKEVVDKIKESISYFEGYIAYTTFFINNLGQGSDDLKPFNILGRIEYVLETFSKFRKERKVVVDLHDIDEDLTGPKVPVALYDGLIHNLYTNALKAVITVHDPKTIKIQAFNDKKNHIIKIMDNGVGIPDKVKKRIWDPMYTTTSNVNNPLGSGIGLGLSLVKNVVESCRGRVELENTVPNGFVTSFKITLPL